MPHASTRAPLLQTFGLTDEYADISLRPHVPQYSVHLVSATTHDIIQSLDLPYLETITSLKVMPLEVSEHTHTQRSMIVLGTAAMRGEDMPARGTVTVLDIIDVVPDPDVPESGMKMKLAAREETKGAVTALESFPGGLVATGQGQKIMVRGLKEDGSCLPVAFLDAQTYICSLKMLGTSGLWLAGDAWKGLWVGGWTEEPFRLSLLGRSRTKMEVLAAEFLPFDGGLYVMAMDGDGDLHCLQYDPENPKTQGGVRLLHRGTFHTGHAPTVAGMMLLPSTLSAPPPPAQTDGDASPDDAETPELLQQILIPSLTGSISLLTPLPESTYRRLSALQTQLTSLLEHAAGLNPRAYRAVTGEDGSAGGIGGRGIIDGALVRRVGELGATRQAEVLGRAGVDGWSLRADLESISGGGLGYL
jgi:cleavage and polyadenylation specificity factor subunit 1